MFTSRAEYRLMLREDNADLRLTKIGRQLNLVDDERWLHFNRKRDAIAQLQTELSKHWIRPDTDKAQQAEALWGKTLQKEVNLAGLLARPEVDVETLLNFAELTGVDEQVADQVAIQAKYAGYITRQQTEIDRNKRYDHLRLPPDENYSQVSGLSNEVSEKLKRHRPETLGQASRIPGITPAAISLLLVHLKKKSA